MKLVFLLALVAVAAMSNKTTTEDNRTVIESQEKDNKYFSPIAMCHTWPPLPRLMLTIFITVFASTSNGYFISSFFVAKDFMKIGNVFLACVGLSDFLISGGAMVISCVVLISAQTLDTTDVCKIVQTLVTTSTYCYSIFFSLVALVAWCRVSQTRKIFRKYLPAIVGIICSMLFLGGFALAYAGTYHDLDYDYCERQHRGNEYFRLATGAIHGVTLSVTVCVLVAAYLKLKRRNRGNGRYRRSFQFQRDNSMIKLNLVVYLLYVLFWVPYMIVVNFYPDAPDWIFYQTAWLAISRSFVSSMVYGIGNGIFAKTYTVLFNYCFCKVTIKNYRNRQGRLCNGNATRPKGDVRTHILMQPTVNVIGPQQAL